MIWWPAGHMSGWGWAGMTITTLLFWAILVGAGVLLVRTSNRSSTGPLPGPRPSPQELLAGRFARGEIDEDEYRRRLTTLTGSGHPTPTL